MATAVLPHPRANWKHAHRSTRKARKVSLKFDHEKFVHDVRAIVAAHQPPEIAERIRHIKLVYGVGNGSYRGICYYGVWKNGQPKPVDLVEIAATGEENPVQLAGTTVHELGHVLAGHTAGHGKDWKAAADVLGLRLAKAAGHVYRLAYFTPAIRGDIAALIAKIADGNPVFARGLNIPVIAIKPCSLGIGTRGGKSRGKGSGSRLRKYVCGCGIKVRVASDDFQAKCLRCTTEFKAAV